MKENANENDFSKKEDSEVATIPTILLSTQDINKNKKSNDISSIFSILNSNLYADKDKKEKRINNNNDGNKTITFNKNYDFELNTNDKNKGIIFNNFSPNNNRYKSISGISINEDFINEAMLSYDDTSSKDKNTKRIDNHNMLNYSEKIKINSYEGYFNCFNCICLFSFENFFDFNNKCSCFSINYEQLQRNVLNHFIDYIPRKNTDSSKTK